MPDFESSELNLIKPNINKTRISFLTFVDVEVRKIKIKNSLHNTEPETETITNILWSKV